MFSSSGNAANFEKFGIIKLAERLDSSGASHISSSKRPKLATLEICYACGYCWRFGYCYLTLAFRDCQQNNESSSKDSSANRSFYICGEAHQAKLN